MGGFALIVRRDLRDLSRGAAFRVVTAAFALAAVGMALGAGALAAVPSASAGADSAQRTALLGTILYFATLFPMLVYLWIFAGAGLAKEKASGHMETLLATPLSPRTLWTAKAAAIVLPGLAVAAFSSILIAAALALAPLFGAGARASALPPAVFAVSWIGNPVLLSGLGALTVVVSLRSSPDAALVPSFTLGFFLMGAYPAATATGIVDPSSWVFAAGYLAAGALEWAVVFLLAKGLSKEKIVTSIRGD